MDREALGVLDEDLETRVVPCLTRAYSAILLTKRTISLSAVGRSRPLGPSGPQYS
jgi:hypothetical protein